MDQINNKSMIGVSEKKKNLWDILGESVNSLPVGAEVVIALLRECSRKDRAEVRKIVIDAWNKTGIDWGHVMEKLITLRKQKLGN